MAAREGAVNAKRAGLCQLRNLLVTTPEPLRGELRPLTPARLLQRLAATRPERRADPELRGALLALRCVARRLRQLTSEEREPAREIEKLIRKLAPQLLEQPGMVRSPPHSLSSPGHTQAESPPKRLRTPRGLRTDPRLLRPDDPLPPRPQRRPQAQPRPAHDPRHPTPRARPDDRLHRAPHPRRQESPRSDPLPQALPRPQPLPAPRETDRRYRLDKHRSITRASRRGVARGKRSVSRLLKGSPLWRGKTRALECTGGTGYASTSEPAGQTEVEAVRHSPGGAFRDRRGACAGPVGWPGSGAQYLPVGGSRDARLGQRGRQLFRACSAWCGHALASRRARRRVAKF